MHKGLKSLILGLLLFSLEMTLSCQNAEPTVTLLGAARSRTPVAAANAQNFFQLNASSHRETLAGGYKGTVRISQPLADIQATTGTGYKLKGTVSLVK